jgi:glutaredoxin 3
MAGSKLGKKLTYQSPKLDLRSSSKAKNLYLQYYNYRKIAMPAVKMYTTAVCPFCVRAKQILQSKGVAHIEEVRVDLLPDERVKMMEITGRRSVPQIFIGDTHVGGCDDLMALDSQGGLMPLLQA